MCPGARVQPCDDEIPTNEGHVDYHCELTSRASRNHGVSRDGLVKKSNQFVLKKGHVFSYALLKWTCFS
jgi:hypothetical protein